MQWNKNVPKLFNPTVVNTMVLNTFLDKTGRAREKTDTTHKGNP